MTLPVQVQSVTPESPAEMLRIKLLQQNRDRAQKILLNMMNQLQAPQVTSIIKSPPRNQVL